MMIRINDVKVPISYDEDALKRKIAKLIHVSTDDILSVTIDKRSIDARKKPEINYVLRLVVEVKDEKKVLKNKSVVGRFFISLVFHRLFIKNLFQTLHCFINNN